MNKVSKTKQSMNNKFIELIWNVLKPTLIGLIPGIIIAVIPLLQLKSFNLVIIILITAVVVISLFYLWLLLKFNIYSKWAIIVGVIATLISGVIVGINWNTYHIIDLKYNSKLSKLCDENYPNFQNTILNQDELQDFKKISEYWYYSHVYAGKGKEKNSSAKKTGVECELIDFTTLDGVRDQGERVPIVEIANRTGIKLKWDLQEGTWCSFSIETSCLLGVSYQRRFDLDRYKTLTFDILCPSPIYAKEIYVRLEDDASMRNPNIRAPFSTNEVSILKKMPSPNPNQWSTIPIILILTDFSFKPDSWIDDFDSTVSITNREEAFPDKHHIAQVTFVVVGESKSIGEFYITNLRFD